MGHVFSTSEAAQDAAWIQRRQRLDAIEARLGVEPGADLLCEKAKLLDLLGQTTEARSLYFDILTEAPTHAATLGAFGALLYRTDYRGAAHAVFAQAVAHHPTRADFRVGLATLLRQAGDPAGARREYEAALQAAPDLAEAHQGLGDLLSDLGDEAAAAEHRRRGHAASPLSRWAYRGSARPVRVLMPISVADGNIAARVFLSDQVFAVTTLCMEFCGESQIMPPQDVVLNAIGDADLCRPALFAALTLESRSTVPVINPPSRVLRTGRAEMAALLAMVPDIVVPRMHMLPRAALLGADGATVLEGHGFRLPVLLRAPGFHTGRHFERADTPADIARVAASLPGEAVLAIECLDAAGHDGKPRKGRVMVIEGRLYPLHWAISTHWKVHYFSAEMEADAANRAEEARFLSGMGHFLGARAVRGLAAVAAALGLHYGGIDFGLLADGRIAVFEANATMALVAPKQGAEWAYRQAAYHTALLATQSMIIGKARKEGLLF